MIKIFCLLMFDENEKFDFNEVKLDDEDLGKIERETKGKEKEKNIKEN